MTEKIQKIRERVFGDLNKTEWTVLLLAGAWFFLLLCGYYILRPIREQISTEYGIENLAWLFRAVFITMLVAIPLYAVLVGKFDRWKLVPGIYSFFIGSLVLFWLAMNYVPEDNQIWVARVLYIWISVYGLFIVSFFWSVVGDFMSTDGGRRIFGYIAGGGTLGGLVGSQVALHLVEPIGIANLLLIPAVLLVLAYFVYLYLELSLKTRGAEGPKGVNGAKGLTGKATGGNPFAGFTAVFKSRYLLAICFYGIFLAICGTSVYFQQSEIVKEAIETEEKRTAYFANVNFSVSLLTLFFQLVLVSRLMKWFGVGWALAGLPIAYIIGITSLAISPSIEVLAVISVLGRAAEYGIANPAREVLFTSVNREDRYKAKSFIDTIVRRGGDTMIGTLYRTLRESVGLAMVVMSWLVIPIAVAWAGLALFIGRENQRVKSGLDSK